MRAIKRTFYIPVIFNLSSLSITSAVKVKGNYHKSGMRDVFLSFISNKNDSFVLPPLSDGNLVRSFSASVATGQSEQ